MRFLGEGGKKRVFLAHDERLDRDVAFALIKTDGLYATGRERIIGDAQAMRGLGSHPHVVHVVTIIEVGGRSSRSTRRSARVVDETSSPGEYGRVRLHARADAGDAARRALRCPTRARAR